MILDQHLLQRQTTLAVSWLKIATNLQQICG